MFEGVTITSDNIDDGAIAEALIYYGQTRLILSRGGLRQVAKSFGRQHIVQLVDAGNLSLVFEQQNYAVQTNSGPFRTHDFGMISLAATVDGRKIKNPYDEIEEMMLREFGSSKETKAFARDLADRVEISPVKDGILEAARQDILDGDYMTRAVSSWLSVMVPEYELPKNFSIDTADTGQGFVFVSGLNFEEINKFYHRRVSPQHSSVTDGYLLAHIVGVRKELAFGAESRSDIWLGAGHAAMLREKTTSLLRQTTSARKDIDLFHGVEFEGRMFREAINGGDRSLDELVRFLALEDTRRFKAWLVAQSDDATLIKEYHKAFFEKTGWMHSLPFKTIKLMIFSGLGALIDLEVGSMGLATAAATALGMASDVVVGASDEFLLSRSKTGWKPTQFIEGPAREFLKS